MRKYTCIIFFTVIHGIILGQSAEEKVVQMKDDLAVQEDDTVFSGRHTPVTWNLFLGTGYAFVPGTGSGMMFHAAPVVTLPVTGRWSFHGGVTAMRYYGLGSPLFEETGNPHVFSSLALFAAASYRMNDRLILHGTGVKQLVSAPETPFAAPDHFSFGAAYRLGNNITIGATIHMNQGNRYLSSPFHGGGFYSPVHGDGLYFPHTWQR